MSPVASTVGWFDASSGAMVRADEVLGHGLLAKAHWRRGEVHHALRSANEAARLGEGSEPTSRAEIYCEHSS